MTKRLALVPALGLAGLLLTGCGDDASSASTGDSVEVVAAFYPFEFVAEQVGGDRVAVSNMTKPGAEPHDLELTPKQVASVAEADLVVYLEGFQPAADEAIEAEAGERAFEVTSVVPLVDTGAEAVEDEHEGEEHADEEHAHDLAGDPHLWLDPTNLVPIAEAIRDRLVDLDPAGAEEYDANTDALVTTLTDLDERMAAGLGDCDRTTFVTSHAAFGYLAAAYALEQVSIAGLSPEEDPSPARLAEVAEIAEREGVTTIFYETLVSPDVAQTLADELDLATDVLDPIEGVAEGSDEDYLSLMDANLSALVAANGCT